MTELLEHDDRRPGDRAALGWWKRKLANDEAWAAEHLGRRRSQFEETNKANLAEVERLLAAVSAQTGRDVKA